MTTTTTTGAAAKSLGGGTLAVRDLSRRFGEALALDGVSFDVRPGVMTGFIGANGAGKTTTMRIILGVLAADSGTVTWDGVPVDADARRSFGYMPEERGLYPKMGLLDQLVFFGRLYGLDAATARTRGAAFLERLGLGDRAKDKLDALSLGNQQRVQLAAALVHEPRLLVLDEPFSGLDPVAVDNVAAMLRDQAADGVPVLFSSHQLDLVERLCDDVVIIDRGRVVAAGQAEQLRLERAGSRFALDVDDAAGLVEKLHGLPFVRSVRVGEPSAAGGGPATEVVAELTALDADQDLLRAAVGHGAVRRFTRVVPSLSEIFQEAVS